MPNGRVPGQQCRCWGLEIRFGRGVRDGIDKDGVLGLFTGGFTAGAAGISGALIDLRLSVVADLQTQDEGLERGRKEIKSKTKAKSVEEIKAAVKRHAWMSLFTAIYYFWYSPMHNRNIVISFHPLPAIGRETERRVDRSR